MPQLFPRSWHAWLLFGFLAGVCLAAGPIFYAPAVLFLLLVGAAAAWQYARVPVVLFVLWLAWLYGPWPPEHRESMSWGIAAGLFVLVMLAIPIWLSSREQLARERRDDANRKADEQYRKERGW